MYNTKPASTDPQKKGAGMARPLLPRLRVTSQDKAASCSVVVIVAIAVVPVAIVPVAVDMVDEDADTTVGAAANLLTNGRGIAAGADYPHWRRLRDEDE